MIEDQLYRLSLKVKTNVGLSNVKLCVRGSQRQEKAEIDILMSHWGMKDPIKLSFAPETTL